MYDLIGDIHGHADKLKSLLNCLGYKMDGESYIHPERKVVFVGDYIDRGPKIPETLTIVKKMVDSGNAIALMGNHEYNAICFNLKARNGDFVRKHSIKHFLQHYETLRQFQNRQEEYDDFIDWFLTLRLFYEADAFRAVHACWDSGNIAFLKDVLQNDRVTPEIILQTYESKKLYRAIDETLKGKEITLKEGLFFYDKDGNKRNEIRIKWWEDASQHTYQSYSVLKMDLLPNVPIVGNHGNHYSHEEKPIFFGHYWLQGKPSLYRNNICCLDYSVAKKGKLVAYSFDDEQELSDIKITYV
jgi:hypothetical protein